MPGASVSRMSTRLAGCEKVGLVALGSNKRISKEAILNRSCAWMGVAESMLLIGTLQNRFSTAY
jgi:hypothetical protein